MENLNFVKKNYTSFWRDIWAMPGVAKLPDPTSRIPKSSYDREPQDTHHFTRSSSSANTPILQKDSEVSLLETEIEIEMKKHKIISIIEMKIFLQNIIEIQSKLNLKK
jgi:hypothetical protein